MAQEKTLINSPSRLIGYLVLAVIGLIGIWALIVRFSEGHIITNTTQHVPWGFWVALYIYFLGLSAGSFLLSTLIYVFGVKRLEAVGPMALLQALGCLLIGGFLIFIDLGHPERFQNVLIYWNWTSILAWMALFYLAYVIIILAELYLVLKPAHVRLAHEAPRWRGLYRFLSLGGTIPDSAWSAKAARWLKVLGIIGIPTAIGVHGGVGAIFAVVKSRPTWYTGLFPIIFLVSALASGGALLTFLAAASKLPTERKRDLVQGLARLTIGIVALDLLLIVSEVLVTFYGGVPRHIVGWKLILYGPYWWVFWFIQLGLGTVVPILIVLHPKTGRSIGWLGAAGLMVAIAVVGVRLNIVVPALIDPQFPTLPEAYNHMRFAIGYFPSLNEWLVGVGTIALGIWSFLLAKKILPLEEGGPGSQHQVVNERRIAS